MDEQIDRPATPAIGLAVHLEQSAGDQGIDKPTAKTTAHLVHGPVATQLGFEYDDVGDTSLARDATWPRLVTWCDSIRDALRSTPDGGIKALAIDEAPDGTAHTKVNFEAKLDETWWKTEFVLDGQHDVATATEAARRAVGDFLDKIESDAVKNARAVIPGLAARLHQDVAPPWLFRAARILDVPLKP